MNLPRLRRWCRSLSILLIFVVPLIIFCGCMHRRSFSPGKAQTSDTQLEQHLRTDIEHLASAIGARNVYHPSQSNEAAAWILQEFKNAGYSVASEAFALHGEFRLGADEMAESATNYFVELPGPPGSPLIVVGDHYDTIADSRQWTGSDTNEFRPNFPGTPGANDNASGVAALLAAARELKNHLPDKLRTHTIRLVAFANEEPPFFQERNLMGSSIHATHLRAQNIPVRMMIALDTLAVYSRSMPVTRRAWYLAPLLAFLNLPNRTDYVAFMSNWDTHSGTAAVEWARVFARHSSVNVRTLSLPFMASFGKEIFAWSDDWSFTRLGYPAFTITDTAFYRSDRYHEFWDTPENLTAADIRSYAAVVRALSDTLIEMAKSVTTTP